MGAFQFRGVAHEGGLAVVAAMSIAQPPTCPQFEMHSMQIPRWRGEISVHHTATRGMWQLAGKGNCKIEPIPPSQIVSQYRGATQDCSIAHSLRRVHMSLLTISEELEKHRRLRWLSRLSDAISVKWSTAAPSCLRQSKEAGHAQYSVRCAY